MCYIILIDKLPTICGVKKVFKKPPIKFIIQCILTCFWFRRFEWNDFKVGSRHSAQSLVLERRQ